MRDTFPLVCFQTKELKEIVSGSIQTKCIICGQEVWRAKTATLTVLNEEGELLEKIKRVQQRKHNLKPVCTDCATDMWAAMNIIKPVKSKKDYNQT